MIQKSYIFFILLFIFSLVLFFINKKEYYKDYYMYTHNLNSNSMVKLDFNQIDIDDGIAKDTINEKRLISLNDFLNLNYNTLRPLRTTKPTITPSLTTQTTIPKKIYKRFVYCVKEKGTPRLNDSETAVKNKFKLGWDYRPLYSFEKTREFRPKMVYDRSGTAALLSMDEEAGEHIINPQDWGLLYPYVQPYLNYQKWFNDFSYAARQSIKQPNNNLKFNYLSETDIELVCDSSFETKMRLSKHFLKKISDNNSTFYLTSLLGGYYTFREVTDNVFKSHIIHPRLADVLQSDNIDNEMDSDYSNSAPLGSEGYKWSWEYQLEIYEVSDKISEYPTSNFFEKNVRMYDENAGKWGMNQNTFDMSQIQSIPVDMLIENGVLLKVFESSQSEFNENYQLFFGEQKYTEQSLKHDDGPILYRYILECNSTIEIQDTLVIKDPGKFETVVKPGIPDDNGKYNDTTNKIENKQEFRYTLIDNIKRIKNLPIMFDEKICLQNKNGDVACLSAENIDVVNGIRPIKINTFPKNPVFDIPMKYEDNVKMCLEASKISTLDKAQYVFKGAPCNNSKDQDFFLKFYDENDNIINDYHSDINTIPKQPHLHFHKHIEEHENESKRDVVRTDVEDDVQQEYINT